MPVRFLVWLKFALFFATTSVVGALVAVIVVLTGGKGREFCRQRVLKPFARELFRLLRIPVNVSFVDPAQQDFPGEKVFFIANHSSILDVPLVVALGLLNARFFISKWTIRFLPITLINLSLGTFFLNEQTEPEKRRQTFRMATRVLKRSGDSAFLHPEGLRVGTGRIGKFNKAAIHMATLLQRPIVPLFFALPERLPGHDEAPGETRVYVLPTIATQDWREEDVPANVAAVREVYVGFHQQIYGGQEHHAVDFIPKFAASPVELRS
jgi:1-acyl-sn-glycerol-3-phosphate acyltransferase